MSGHVLYTYNAGTSQICHTCVVWEIGISLCLLWGESWVQNSACAGAYPILHYQAVVKWPQCGTEHSWSGWAALDINWGDSIGAHHGRASELHSRWPLATSGSAHHDCQVVFFTAYREALCLEKKEQVRCSSVVWSAEGLNAFNDFWSWQTVFQVQEIPLSMYELEHTATKALLLPSCSIQRCCQLLQKRWWGSQRCLPWIARIEWGSSCAFQASVRRWTRPRKLQMAADSPSTQRASSSCCPQLPEMSRRCTTAMIGSFLSCHSSWRHIHLYLRVAIPALMLCARDVNGQAL